LSIDNSFGSVLISTWDKNEISIEVEIGVKTGSDQKATGWSGRAILLF
jgi:hypothetical protein